MVCLALLVPSCKMRTKRRTQFGASDATGTDSWVVPASCRAYSNQGCQILHSGFLRIARIGTAAMAGNDDTDEPPIGLSTHTDCKIINTLRASKLKEHYPYDCPHAHCTSAQGRCRSSSCTERLDSRLATLVCVTTDVSATLSELSDEVRAMQSVVARTWEGAFTYVVPDKA